MSDPTFTTIGDEALEARIVSWVLGEASAFEAAELERLCAEHPELQHFRNRIAALHGILGEAENQGNDEDWKLSPEKRKPIEELIKAEPVADPRKENGVRKSARTAILAIAACVVLTVVVSGLLSPMVIRQKKSASGDIFAYYDAGIEEEMAEIQPDFPPELIEGTPNPMKMPNRNLSYRQVQPKSDFEGREDLASLDLNGRVGNSYSGAASPVLDALAQNGNKESAVSEPKIAMNGNAPDVDVQDDLGWGDGRLMGRRSGVTPNQGSEKTRSLAMLDEATEIEVPGLQVNPRPASKSLVSPAPPAVAEPEAEIATNELWVPLSGLAGKGRTSGPPAATAAKRGISQTDAEKSRGDLLASLESGGEKDLGLRLQEGEASLDSSFSFSSREEFRKEQLTREVAKRERRRSAALDDDFGAGGGGAGQGAFQGAYNTWHFGAKDEDADGAAIDKSISQFDSKSAAGEDSYSDFKGEAAQQNPTGIVAEIYRGPALERAQEEITPAEEIEELTADARVNSKGYATLELFKLQKKLKDAPAVLDSSILTETERLSFSRDLVAEISSNELEEIRRKAEGLLQEEPADKEAQIILRRLDEWKKEAEQTDQDPTEPEPTPFEEEVSAADDPFSTFSLNISDASFRIAQAALAKGEQPDPTGIKVEQFYNAVDYGDPAPATGQPVACAIEQTAHPVIPGRNLVRIALKTAAAGRSAGQPLRLTLLVDQSGSMTRGDRREAMDKALEGLAGLLTPQDQVNVVGFSRTSRLIAEGLAGDKAAAQLADVVNPSASEGGTNMETAIDLATEMALRHKTEGAQNRIVLFTDGAANLGDADPERLAAKVEQLRQQGLAFDIAGIAAEDINDRLLAELARKGNGRYHIVGKGDGGEFAKQLAGAFRPAAENVKVQVQVRFNPERVKGYKLLGFEKDRLKKEDFRNDSVDAAEMAAEEAGVAIYQVEPIPGGSGEIGEVSVRFRDTTSGEMFERSWTVSHDAATPVLERATPSMQLATLALFAGEKLRGGPLGDAIDFHTYAPVQAAVKQAFGHDSRIGDLLRMIDALK